MVGVAESSVTMNGHANGVSKNGAPAQPAKIHVQYDDLHKAIASSLPRLDAAGFGDPDYLIAISGGGLIPARILRSQLRLASGKGKKAGFATIKVIGLELYDDSRHGMELETGVTRTQWLNYHDDLHTQILGKKVLIVDEVDDSRQTLCFAVKELLRDLEMQTERFKQQNVGVEVPETKIGVYVIHNKQRPKKGELPPNIEYFVAQQVVGNPWIVYPWDAIDIELHNQAAKSVI